MEEIKNLQESCEKLSDALFTIEVLNLNFDNPPPATLSKSSAEWRSFEFDMENFFQEHFSGKVEHVKKILSSPQINKEVIEELKFILHKAEKQFNKA